MSFTRASWVLVYSAGLPRSASLCAIATVVLIIAFPASLSARASGIIAYAASSIAYHASISMTKQRVNRRSGAERYAVVLQVSFGNACIFKGRDRLRRR